MFGGLCGTPSLTVPMGCGNPAVLYSSPWPIPDFPSPAPSTQPLAGGPGRALPASGPAPLPPLGGARLLSDTYQNSRMVGGLGFASTHPGAVSTSHEF